MKVPVYQPQVSYQKNTAQVVRQQQPVYESFGKKEWADMAAAGAVMRGVYELPGALNRTVDSFQKANDSWQEEWKKVAENIAGKKTEKSQSQPSEAAARSVLMEDKRTGEFSAPQRSEQLSFARERVFSADTDGENADTLTGADSAVQRLDKNFMALFTQSPHNYGPGEERLLAQDFVILRREVQQLEEKSRQLQAQEEIKQGAATFVQTAAMVRTPRALESYIKSNLRAAAQEAGRAGLSEAAWTDRARALEQEAVRHNVEAALEAGEAERADAIFRHFAARLPADQQQTLEKKITARRADLVGETLWPAARKACADSSGRADEKRLADFARSAAARETDEFKQQLVGAFKARLAQSRRRDLQRRATGYLRLANAESGADLAALMNGDCFREGEFERNCNALRAQQSGEAKGSSAAVFNRLNQALLAGKLEEKEAEKAFDGGALSARDYWRLKGRWCAAEAGADYTQSRLLAQAVGRFCRQNGLSAQESEDALYFVFTAGESAEEQRKAALAVKQLFLLQENKQ